MDNIYRNSGWSDSEGMAAVHLVAWLAHRCTSAAHDSRYGSTKGADFVLCGITAG